MSALPPLFPDFASALRPVFRGELSRADADRDFYSAAACIYEIRPEGAAWPVDEEDAVQLVRAARRSGLAVTARGSGSGVAGHAVGSGVVADLSRHMNRILEIDPQARTARVQPGVMLSVLNAALRPEGLHFAPDPSSASFCTIGGMIANNAGGAHSTRDGCTRENLVSLTAVTGAGERLVTRARGREELEKPGTCENDRLSRSLLEIARGREEIIERHSMKTARNSSGYDLLGALGGPAPAEGNGQVDLARLLCGSEGTLALLTEATVALRPLPGARATALALFDDLDSAGEAIVRSLPFRPSCGELVSETLLDMMRADSRWVRDAAPEPARAVILFEMDGGTEAEAAAGLERLREELVTRGRVASGFTAVSSPEDREALWQVRHLASPTLTRHAGARRNMRFIEDACVPPERLSEFLSALQRLFDRERIEAAVFGHALDSLVHVNPLMMATRPASLAARMEAISGEFTSLVAGLGGTLTGEHGDGRLRTPHLPKMFGPLYPLFDEVKRMFDPDGVLNPGIISGALGPRAARLTEHLRPGPTPWMAPEA